jgi:hypothetical protein
MIPWTLELVGTVNEITAEQHVYSHQENEWASFDARNPITLPWPWIMLVQRLCWTYGIDGALSRLNENARRSAA